MTGEEDKPQREKEHFLYSKLFSLSLVVLAVALAEYLGTPSPFCPPSGGQRRGSRGKWPGEEDKPQRKKKHFLFRRLFSISCRFGCSTGRVGEVTHTHRHTDTQTHRQTEAQLLWILLRDTRPSDSVIGNLFLISACRLMSFWCEVRSRCCFIGTELPFLHHSCFKVIDRFVENNILFTKDRKSFFWFCLIQLQF